MRRGCTSNSDFATGALLFELTRKTFSDPFPLPAVTQDVAQFLLVRGPYAWLGHNWMGCFNEFAAQKRVIPTASLLRPPELDVDYGTPIDPVCKETGPNSGVFVRNYTKVSVEMDCNSWTAQLRMK